MYEDTQAAEAATQRRAERATRLQARKLYRGLRRAERWVKREERRAARAARRAARARYRRWLKGQESYDDLAHPRDGIVW